MKADLASILSKLAQSWLDPRSEYRRQALASAAEFCLSIPSFELALDWIFQQWTEATIRKCIADNPYKQCRYAVQILAGNTPAIIAQGFLQGTILAIPQCIKLPSKQATFAKLLHQSLAKYAPELAQLFEVSTWQGQLETFYSRLKKADVVLAYGSDETMATLQEYISPETLYAAHGHAESAAILFKEASNRDSLHKLAYDMLSYDQRGCLSPRVAYVEAGGELSPSDCAQIFAQEILPPIAAQLPRGGLFAGEGAEILHQRSVFGFRGPVYCGQDWTVCYLEKPIWPPISLPRFLPFAAFNSVDELKLIMKKVENHLVSLGYAGPENKMLALQDPGKSRLCSLGEMQKQLLVF